jgi:hypothetical protein
MEARWDLPSSLLGAMANDEAPAEAVDGAPWNPESVLRTPYELGFRLLAVSMQLLEGFD